MHEYCPALSIYKCIYRMMSIEKRADNSCINIVLPCLSINVYSISYDVYREESRLFMHKYFPDMSIYKCIYLNMSIEKRHEQSIHA